jgi:hypothetical protein
VHFVESGRGRGHPSEQPQRTVGTGIDRTRREYTLVRYRPGGNNGTMHKLGNKGSESSNSGASLPDDLLRDLREREGQGDVQSRVQSCAPMDTGLVVVSLAAATGLRAPRILESVIGVVLNPVL